MHFVVVNPWRSARLGFADGKQPDLALSRSRRSNNVAVAILRLVSPHRGSARFALGDTRTVFSNAPVHVPLQGVPSLAVSRAPRLEMSTRKRYDPGPSGASTGRKWKVTTDSRPTIGLSVGIFSARCHFTTRCRSATTGLAASYSEMYGSTISTASGCR